MSLPKGWRETTLGEVSTISSSKRIFHSEYVTEGIPFYRSKEIIEKQKGNNISIELFITEEKYNEIKNKYAVPTKNDLLLTSVGTLGIPYLVKEDEIFYFKDGNLTWFREYADLKPLFLYYFFLSSTGKERLNEITIGSTQSALTISGLKQISINLPPLQEQKAIASILSSFDEKIELLKEQNKTLEKMAQVVFKEWFVDEVDESWKIGTLSEEFDIIMGQSPKGDTYNEDKKGMVFYQGRADFQIRFPKRRLYTTDPKRVASKFDVLISVRAPVGDINVANEECCIGRGLASIHSKYSSYALYKMKSLKKQFDMFESEGTVFGSINKTSLESLEVVIPPSNMVLKYDNYASTIDKKIYSNSNQIQTLQKTRDTLLPKLMSGELRVEEKQT